MCVFVGPNMIARTRGWRKRPSSLVRSPKSACWAPKFVFFSLVWPPALPVIFSTCPLHPLPPPRTRRTSCRDRQQTRPCSCSSPLQSYIFSPPETARRSGVSQRPSLAAPVVPPSDAGMGIVGLWACLVLSCLALLAWMSTSPRSIEVGHSRIHPPSPPPLRKLPRNVRRGSTKSILQPTQWSAPTTHPSSSSPPTC